MRIWLPLLLLLTAACGTVEDPDTERTAEQERFSEDLRQAVRPVVEDYITAMIAADVPVLYDMQSTDLKREKTALQFAAHWKENADRYSSIARTIHVNWIKPHEIYAIAQIKSSQGTEYWGLIKESGLWKIHRTSKDFLRLLDALR